MKKKLLFILIAVLLCVTLCLTACQCKHDFVDGTCTKCGEADPNYQPPCEHAYVNGTCTECGATDADYVPTPISTVLTKVNNTQVEIKAVVFAKTTEGYYVSDGTGNLFVKDTANTVAVGDQVRLAGSYRIVDKCPQLFVSALAKDGTGTAATPVAKTIAEIAALDEGAKASYAGYYATAGIVEVQNGIVYLVSGDNKLVVNAKSNAAAFEEFAGKKVAVNVVVHSYSNQLWTVSFCDKQKDIEIAPLLIAEVKDAVFAYVTENIATEAFGELALVTTYEAEPDLVLTWSVAAGSEAVATVVDNVAKVAAPAVDTPFALVLTLTSLSNNTADNTASQTFNFTAKPIETIAIADLATANLGAAQNIFVEGTVIHKMVGTNAKALVVADASNNVVRVDVTDEVFATINLGDQVKVLGKYNTDAGVYRIQTINLEVTTAYTGEGFVVDYTAFDATEIGTIEEYRTAIAAMRNNPIKLFKITNPYIRLSSSTLANSTYMRLTTTASSGRVDNTYMSIHNEDLALAGYSDWAFIHEVPSNDVGASKAFEGLTIYAFSSFIVDNYVSATYSAWQFSVVEGGMVVDYDKALKLELPTEVDATVAGTVNLPQHSAWVGDITWTANPGLIDVVTGAYEAQTTTEVVKLTATYTVAGEAVTKEFFVTLNAGGVTYLTTTEFIAREDGVVPAVKGTIVGFGTGTHDGVTSKAPQNGIFISDGNTIVYVTGWSTFVEGEIMLDKLYAYDGTPLGIGDVISAKMVSKSSNTANVANATVEVVKAANVAEADKMVWNPTSYATVNGKATASEVFKAVEGTHSLIKFEATLDNPLYFATSTAYKFRLWFGDFAPSYGALADIKLDNRIVSTKIESSELNLGAKWWEAHYAEGLVADPPKSYSNTNYPFVGTIWVAHIDTTTGFQMVTFLAPGFDVHAMTAEEKQQAEVNKVLAAVPGSQIVEEAGVVALPENALITWTAEGLPTGFELTGSNLSYPAVTAETTVTVVANYTVGNTAKTASFTITFTPGKINYSTPTQAAALEAGTAVNLEGYVAGVAGFHKKADTTPYGLFVVDQGMLVCINTFGGQLTASAGKVYAGETALNVGDLVRITGLTANGKAMAASADTKVEVVSTGNNIAGDWFNPTDALVIDSHADFVAYVGTITDTTMPNYQVVKFSATETEKIYMATSIKYAQFLFFADPTWDNVNAVGSHDKFKVAAGYDKNGSPKLTQLAIMNSVLANNLTEEWVLANTTTTSVVLGADGTAGTVTTTGTRRYTDNPFNGSCYFVFEYENSGGYTLGSIIGAGFSLTPVTAQA